MPPLHTNDPPTDEGAALTRKVLTKPLGSINLIDHEIGHLQDRLNTLSLEQRQLHASLEIYRGILSPIRRLLPEILQEIFCHCLPTAHNAVMNATEAPLLLGRVCSRWRRVACSTPKLWASIHITAILPSDFPYSQKQAVTLQRAISLWLSRSSALPLSISLVVRQLGPCLRRDSVHTCNDKVQPYFDLLVAYAHRWRSINFTIYCFHWMAFFNRFHASEVPLLENLYIDGDHYSDPEQQSVIRTLSRPDNILHAPRLRVLSIPPYFKCIPEFGIQLQNITGIDVGYSCLLYLEDILKVLGLCPNLRTCAISDWISPLGLDEVPVDPITLPKLQSLTLSPHRYAHRPLKSLITPALRHLLLPPDIWLSEPAVSEPDHIYDCLGSFLRHLIDPLEELDLRSKKLTSERRIADILSLVPELKRLSLNGYHNSFQVAQEVSSSSQAPDLVLAQLTPSDNCRGTPDSQPGDVSSNHDVPTYLCPKLEVLRYVKAECSDNELLDFLRSRTMDHHKHNVSHLRMVGVQISRPERDIAGEVGLRKSIEALEKETGVRVRVDFRYDDPQVLAQNWESPPVSRHSPFDGLPVGSETGSRPFLF
ncbi:hypothetical protein P691DRAFT_806399 [Macrolepiota fuliginosa MF-IS2]|uniref:F-box domain-containing protein n=1 Tax=Macrolepiota fuliginosa MF-IS2 TaxID=1400762 RepID=A0A9P5X6G3_9AGAR|nr:hypothetical protein P691DRAFT_806399 [Macrolepiota fuliginosa MF-IS2]